MAQEYHVPGRLPPLKLTDHPLLSHLYVISNTFTFALLTGWTTVLPRGGSGGKLSIGAVIVLNGWLLRPAWFCYSSCPQLERLPTAMIAMWRHHCTDLSLPLESANAGLHSYHEWCSITAQLPPICYKPYIAVLAWSFLSTQLFFFFYNRYFSLDVLRWTDVYFHKGLVIRAGFLS